MEAAWSRVMTPDHTSDHAALRAAHLGRILTLRGARPPRPRRAPFPSTRHPRRRIHTHALDGISAVQPSTTEGVSSASSENSQNEEERTGRIRRCRKRFGDGIPEDQLLELQLDMEGEKDPAMTGERKSDQWWGREKAEDQSHVVRGLFGSKAFTKQTPRSRDYSDFDSELSPAAYIALGTTSESLTIGLLRVFHRMNSRGSPI